MKGYRRKAVGSHAQLSSIRSNYGQHRDPGREAAQQLPKLGGVDLGGCQKTIRPRKIGFSTSRTGTNPPATPMIV